MKWRKGYDPEAIVQRVQVGRSNKNGRVSWKGSSPREWISVLISAIDLGADRSWAHKRFAVSRAVWSSNLNVGFSASDLLKEIRKKSGEYRRQKMKTFKVLFYVHGVDGLKKNRFKINGCSINLNPSKKSRFFLKATAERERISKEAWFKFSAELPSINSKAPVIVNVMAHEQYEAFELAELSLGAFLGALNLFHNFRRGIAISSDHDIIFHKSWWVPFASVHNEDGSLATELIWYNHWSKESLRSLEQKYKNDKASKFIDHLLYEIRHHRWAGDAFEVLAAYYEAFAIPSMETAFLNGWRLLEKVGGYSDTSYDTLRKRGSFVFTDSEVMKQVGLHLQQRRNSISHGRRIDAYDDDRLASQMHMFLRPILWSYLTNNFRVRSRDEFWELLDMPIDSKEMRRRLLLHTKALELRG